MLGITRQRHLFLIWVLLGAAIFSISNENSAPVASGTPTGTLASILAAGKIQVGCNIGWPPFEDYNPVTGEPEGFDIDIMAELAAYMSIKYSQSIAVEWVYSDWNPIIPNLNAGQFDIILSAMTITSARETVVDFTRLYYKWMMGVLVTTANPKGIATLADLNDTSIKIGFQAGTLVYTWAETHLKDTTPTRFLTYNDIPLAFAALELGQVHAVIGDAAYSYYVLSQGAAQSSDVKPVFSFIGDPPDNLGIACRTGDDDLRLALNEAIDSLLGPDEANPVISHSYNAIYKKWHGVDHPAYTSTFPDVIPIGFLTPLTGALASYGPGMQEGAELAEWVVNTKWGGIPRSGLPNATLDLLVRDTATNSTTTAAVTAALIQTDGVEVIVGAAGSSQTLAAAAVTNLAQVVLLSYASTSPNITIEGGEYTFRVAASDALQGWALADLALGKGYRNAASLIQNKTWPGLSTAEVFREKFEAGGGTVVAKFPYNQSAPSFTTELNQIKALQTAGSIDVIMDVSGVSDGAIIFQEAATLGITTPWVCAEWVVDPAIFSTAGAEMRGMWGTDSFTKTTTLEHQQFLSYFNERYPAKSPELYADYAYDAVMLIVDAIIAAGVYDGLAIKNSLQGVSQGWRGATGDKTFDEHGDVGQDLLFWEVTEPTAGSYEFTTRGYWARPVIIKWDNSTVHDIFYLYGGADQAIWDTTLDSYGVTRVYANESFNDAYFKDTTAVIIPMFNNGTNITQAEADAVKKFVDSGGQVLLCGYYHKWYWNWTGQNLIAGLFGVEFVVNEGTTSNYTYTLDDVSCYDSYSNMSKVTNFEPHPITKGVTEWYVRGPSLRITNPDVKVLARGSPTAYYNSSVNSDWINGTDIIHLAVLENSNGGGILFSAGAYVLRNAYTTQHGIDHGYNGSKLVDNVAKWLSNGPDVTPPRISALPNIQHNEGGSEKITWHATDAYPASYVLYCNGAIDDSGPWSGGVLSFGTASLSLGISNYTLLVNDTSGNWAAFTVWVTIIDATAPTIDHPTDITHNEGTSGTLTWQPADAHAANYTLYCNGAVNASGIWTGGELSFALDSLSLGIYNFTLVVNDTAGHWTASTVWVTVIDATLPTIDQPSDITYEEGTTGHAITWQPRDAHPANYALYRNGAINDSGRWPGGELTFEIDGLPLGLYNYTLLVNDTTGNWVASTIWVTIIDATAPAIDQPSDITYEEGTTGHAITWQPTDAHPYWYNITRDGLLVAAGEWTGTAINVDVDDLAVGTHTYILTVYDSSGNSARHTVIVTVIESPDTTPETTPETESDGKTEEPSTSTPGFALPILLLLGIILFIKHEWTHRKQKKV